MDASRNGKPETNEFPTDPTGQHHFLPPVEDPEPPPPKPTKRRSVKPPQRQAELVYDGTERLRRIAVKELARKLLWAINSTFDVTDKAEISRRRLWAEEAANDMVDDQLMYSI